MLECKYGHFSQDGKEYIITNAYTPRPWINVLSNRDYSAIWSQMGGGFSYRINAEQNRLTRHYQDLIKDNWGKYFYIRDCDSGQYWSTALMPIQTPVDNYQVRHGVGYSIFERQTMGIDSQMTVFVCADKPMEYIRITLTNNREQPAMLDLTGYFEWAPGFAYDTHREFQKLFSTLSYEQSLNAVVINKCLWGFPDSKGRFNNDDWPYTGFFGCSAPVDSYDCDKEMFIGMYHTESNAVGMDKPSLSNSNGRYGDPVGCLRTTKITLQPSQQKEVVFVIGMAKHNQEDYKQLLSLCNTRDCEKQFYAIQSMWNDLIFANEWVSTPCDSFNTMTNIWCKYQALSGRMWAKAGYYQVSGGIGYRDQLQDSLVMLENAPEYTKKQILLHASRQFQKGDVQHWWLQLGTVGARSNCSDDFLWLVFAINKYIAETGDYAILDEVVGYVDGGQPSSIYEHCVRSIELSFSRFSPRGIPLMGDHDWNDGLSAVGNGMIGESFWVAEFLYYILQEFIPILKRTDRQEYANKLIDRSQLLKDNFEKHGWDGQWYLQATNDYGDKLGSHTCEEGQIFLNPQIWAVMSDIASQPRQKQAMDSVSKYLLKDYGALLLTPEYKTPNENIGYITRYAPGLRENGGVYTHAATWAVWAYAKMGDNENAYRAYSTICPPNRSADIDRYVAEPYVLSGNSDGPVSPNYGRGGWSWYTGSAQWLHSVAVQWILGVRATLDGLQISPCIPKQWQGFTYKRTYRGVVYDITVINGNNASPVITVNGKRIEGNILPVSNQNCTVIVNL